MHEFVCSYYRVSLAMFEEKLSMISPTGFDFTSPIGSSERRRILFLRSNFCVMDNLLSSIGTFKAFNAEYIPHMHTRRQDGKDMFMPYLVTYSNLRDYVKALACADTDIVRRRFFFDHNPFPNAHWTDEDDEHHPLLLNQDEIAPENYKNFDTLREDMETVRCTIEIIETNYRNLILNKQFKFDSDGHISQLVSSDLGTIRCPSVYRGGVPDYSIGIKGKREVPCWSNEYLDENEFE